MWIYDLISRMPTWNAFAEWIARVARYKCRIDTFGLCWRPFHWHFRLSRTLGQCELGKHLQPGPATIHRAHHNRWLRCSKRAPIECHFLILNSMQSGHSADSAINEPIDSSMRADRLKRLISVWSFAMCYESLAQCVPFSDFDWLICLFNVTLTFVCFFPYQMYSNNYVSHFSIENQQQTGTAHSFQVVSHQSNSVCIDTFYFDTLSVFHSATARLVLVSVVHLCHSDHAHTNFLFSLFPRSFLNQTKSIINLH